MIPDMEKEVMRLVAVQFAVDESRVHRDMLLFDDLGADSQALVELAASLEDAFGIEIPSTQERDFRTVGDLIGLVGEKLGGKKVGGEKLG